MIDLNSSVNLLHAFKDNQKMLNAIGDETRQAIIITLMQSAGTPGMRVGEITERTNLSRPAVLHHLTEKFVSSKELPANIALLRIQLVKMHVFKFELINLVASNLEPEKSMENRHSSKVRPN